MRFNAFGLSRIQRLVHILARSTAAYSEKFAEITMPRDEILSDQGVYKPTLEALVRRSAKPNMMAIEIGSWMGASTEIIAKVVKENNGMLYCVDWWKGNLGKHYDVVHLNYLAQNYNIFDLFEKHLKRIGVSDVVYPLKMSSEAAAKVLKDDYFDFIFIDGEHSYRGVKADIDNYFPKLNVGGIFCGHDCEGKLAQLDLDYIEAHKDTDTDPENRLHCGVILAVGKSFDDYRVENCIWSVVKTENTIVRQEMI